MSAHETATDRCPASILADECHQTWRPPHDYNPGMDEANPASTTSSNLRTKAGAAHSVPSTSMDYLVSILPSSFPLDDEDDYDKAAKGVGVLFMHGTGFGVALWVSLLAAIYRIAPTQSYEQPHGIEQKAHAAVVILLVVVNGSRVLPLLLRRDGPLRSSNTAVFQSGFMRATFSVQCIAVASNLVMATFPTPVLDDSMSGLRFHLVRWAEWIPLTFLLTFLTCNMSTSLHLTTSKSRIRDYFVYPVLLASSAAAGLILPFCSDEFTWWSVLIISWLLFLALFVLLYHRATSYFRLKQNSLASSDSSSAAHVEHLMVARSSYVLCAVCSITWTSLAVLFTFLCLVSKYATPDSLLANPAFPAISMCTFEIMSKVWYFSVLIDAYETIFDERSRAVRRLEAVRSFMGAVWQTSSDVMIFCVAQKDGNVISVRISPAFLRMVGMGSGHMPALNRGDVSLILEVFVKQQTYIEFALDLSSPVTGEDASRFKEALKIERHRLGRQEGLSPWRSNLAALAELAVLVMDRSEARHDAQGNFVQVLTALHADGSTSTIHCEARVAPLKGDACFVVLRDMTDRLARFEAEKKLTSETTYRKKDQEANRFTRHEVKNGILEAISVLDQIKEAVDRGTALGSADQVTNGYGDSLWVDRRLVRSIFRIPSSDLDIRNNRTDDYVSELDIILHDVLDSILDDAMGREIIYDEYQLRSDSTNVPQVLMSLQRNDSGRFPLSVAPDPFPLLKMDRHLLRCIYRNALSNACRYGQIGGEVRTIVKYHEVSGQFSMDVINFPGFGHSALVKLSSERVSDVFSPNTQLLENHGLSTEEGRLLRKESSGNGAWIMQLCAKYLRGKCEIRFDQEKTVFSFCCPALVCHAEPRLAGSCCEGFSLPQGTWGVIIEDSRIQRKLMGRFLQHAGIEKSRRIVLGRTPQEIQSAKDKIISLLRNNARDKFLLISDENLDLDDAATVSGSRIIESLRAELDPATEARLLALVRSANDSAADIATYKERAHGFLAKEPITKDGVLNLLRPWWTMRFISEASGDQGQHSAGTVDRTVR